LLNGVLLGACRAAPFFVWKYSNDESDRCMPYQTLISTDTTRRKAA